MPPSKEMRKTQKVNKGPSALDIVKKKYGKSVMKMEARDEYGDPVGGPKISKKQKAKNLSSNTPDEKHTTTTSEEKLDEKCWPGYEKKGMKTMFGKRYPNCVKKKKTKKEEFSDWRSELEQIEEKKMTKAQIKKRDEIADAISTREMNKRYGDKLSLIHI